MIKYAQELIGLHKKLNSENCPIDIDAQYKKLWSENSKSDNDTKKFLEHELYHVSLHDAYIKNLSQKKNLNSYDIQFKVQAFIYTSEDQEIGYMPVNFSISSKDNFRELNNKCIFEFRIDTIEKNILFIVNSSHMTLQHTVKLLNYSSIDKEFGEIIEYKKSKYFNI